MELKIDNRKLSSKSRPIFVAEISGNHKQSLVIAKKLIKSAKIAGADFVKFQLYEPLDMTLKSNNQEFVINDPQSPWYKKNLFQLYKKSCTKKFFFKKIFSYAKKIKLPCFTSVFNPDAVDFLEKLDVPAYKISSFEINHIPLIERVSKTKKPIIFSTGVANYSEIYEALKICRKNKNNKIVLLHCSSEYPANLKNCNLNHISILKKKYKCLVGFSDHTLGITASSAAISKGAVLIEKHLKLDSKAHYVDEKFSLTPAAFANMIAEGNKTFDSMGKYFFSKNASINFNLKFKRSIYVSKDSNKGEKITIKNISIIRSNKGLHPRYFQNVLNKRFTRDLKVGMPLKISYVE